MAANDVFDPEFQEIFEAFSQRTAQVLSVWYLKITRMGLLASVVFHVCPEGVEGRGWTDDANLWMMSWDSRGESVMRLPDWIVEDLEGREALFEVFKTPEEDVHVFECPRLTIDEEILEDYEDKYPHGPPEEDWDNQSDITEKGENDEAVCRAPPVYVGEPSGVNDPDATQASKRRRTE
ncbi:hypothetical protein CASFOL_017771 [Castilleja foliolosa]|uniref:Uncharacterized protein n=1 Tax=Castilleja foliolosa TaxID=1961234 RepID=A0ABD3D7V9_9LAMI